LDIKKEVICCSFSIGLNLFALALSIADISFTQNPVSTQYFFLQTIPPVSSITHIFVPTGTAAKFTFYNTDQNMTNIEFNKNEDAMKLACSQVKQRLADIYEGGGKKSIEKQREAK
jgi:hypothetical protein